MDVTTTLGILGVIANIIWPLIRQRKYLLAGQVVAATFMCMHFTLLGAYTGAAVMMMAGIQAVLAIPLETSPGFKRIYLASIGMTPLIIWSTWHGLPSIFSSLALILFCIGNLQVNLKYLRVFLLLCLFSWIGHNVLVLSYPALISNLLALITSLWGLARELKAPVEQGTSA